MYVYSNFGQETDIGSNECQFWFWSRRMKPPILYYADHEKLYNTRLKTPFHPKWIIESLGVTKIDIDNAFLTMENDHYKIIQNRRGIYGRPITKITLIDPETLAIVGHYLHDYNRVIASWEIKDHYFTSYGPLPKKIIITWHEENVQTQWDLTLPDINFEFPKDQWEKPNINPKLDLGNEHPTSFLQR